MNFVNPHASQKTCELWVQSGKVWGCGKPFIFDGKKLEKCGYI
jgi:hypothetical protein